MKSIYRFLASGFGTGFTMAKAIGWTIIICLFGVWLIYWIITKIIALCTSKKEIAE